MPLDSILLDAHNPGPMTGRGNHTYLLVDEQGAATLVDAGVGEAGHLESIARELAARHASLAHVIATHGHRDHVAGADALARRYPGARFLKYPGETTEDAVGWHPVSDGDVLQVGSEVLEVLHMPGHAPDHVVLWHAQTRAAWVGDLVIGEGSVAIDWSRGGRMGAYLASLDRLLRLGPQKLYPAHGPAIGSPDRTVSDTIAHRLWREQQVIGALGSGFATVRTIADCIYDGLDASLLPAARETIRAHLEKLKDERRAAADAERWTLV